MLLEPSEHTDNPISQFAAAITVQNHIEFQVIGANTWQALFDQRQHQLENVLEMQVESRTAPPRDDYYVIDFRVVEALFLKDLAGGIHQPIAGERLLFL